MGNSLYRFRILVICFVLLFIQAVSAHEKSPQEIFAILLGANGPEMAEKLFRENFRKEPSERAKALTAFVKKNGWKRLTILPYYVLAKVIEELPEEALEFSSEKGDFGFDRESNLTLTEKVKLRNGVWKRQLALMAAKYDQARTNYARSHQEFKLPLARPVVTTVVRNRFLKTLEEISQLEDYGSYFHLKPGINDKEFLERAKQGKRSLVFSVPDAKERKRDEEVETQYWSEETLKHLSEVAIAFEKARTESKTHPETALPIKMIPNLREGLRPYLHNEELWLPETPENRELSKKRYLGPSRIAEVLGSGVWVRYPSISPDKIYFYSFSTPNDVIEAHGDAIEVWSNENGRPVTPPQVISGLHAIPLSVFSQAPGCRGHVAGISLPPRE